MPILICPRSILIFGLGGKPMPTYTYTHKDKDGVLWRFEGSRPISEIADRVMADLGLLWELPSEEELKEVMEPFYVPPDAA